MNDSNKKIIIIVISVILALMLCCCGTFAVSYVLIKRSTVNSIKENNSYLDFPLETASPTPEATDSTSVSDEALREYTDKLMVAFKKNGTRDLYDNYTSSSFKKIIHYDLYKYLLDPYQDYDSYKISDTTKTSKDKYYVTGSLIKDGKSYYIDLYIDVENGKLYSSDFTITSYKF